MDYFSGWPKRSKNGFLFDKRKAMVMVDVLFAVGDLTGAKMNIKKCHSPVQIIEIINFLYASILKICILSITKQEKYIRRIDSILSATIVSLKRLEKLVGNLTYAAWVAPFGRPFLSTLSEKLHLSKSSSTP